MQLQSFSSVLKFAICRRVPEVKMLKLAVVFSFVLVAFAKADTAPDKNAVIKTLRDAVENCYEDDAKTIKVEVTDAAFESLITGDPNPPRSTKCMRHCIMKAHNLYNKDGTLNIPNMLELFQKVFPHVQGDDKLKIVADLGEKCMEGATAEDKCEKIHEMAMCMISKLSEKGIDIKKI